MSYSDNDLQAFYSYSNKIKAQVLCAYLIEGYNMNEVGINVMNNNSDSQPGRPVSTITRVYGFDGKNSGRFRGLYRKLQPFMSYDPDIKKCALEDCAAFVNKYPRGEISERVMEQFLTERVNARLNQLQNANRPQSQPMSQPQKTHVFTPPSNTQQPSVQRDFNNTPSFQNSSYSNSGKRNDIDEGALSKIGVWVGGFIVAAVLFTVLSNCVGGLSCAGSSCAAPSCAQPSCAFNAPVIDAVIYANCLASDDYTNIKLIVDKDKYVYLDNFITDYGIAADLTEGKHYAYVEYYYQYDFKTTENVEFTIDENHNSITLYIVGLYGVLNFSIGEE